METGLSRQYHTLSGIVLPFALLLTLFGNQILYYSTMHPVINLLSTLFFCSSLILLSLSSSIHHHHRLLD